MEFNPQRSWAVTYTKMWNLCMKQLPVGFQGLSIKNQYQTQSYQTQSFKTQPDRRKSTDYCWSFNKGVRCKYGNECRYIERCSYCDSGSHEINSCHKADKKAKDKFNAKMNGGGPSSSKREL